MRGLLATCLLVVACAVIGVLRSDRHRTGPSEETLAPQPRDTGRGDWLEYQAVINSDTFYQSIWWGHEEDSDNDVLLVKDRELDPATGEFVTTENAYSASFEITDVRSRRADEFYLAGVARNGDDVIEKWEVVPVPGGYVALRPPATTAIGITAVSSTTSVTIVGGQFVRPQDRTTAPSVFRTEVYRGQGFGGVSAMAVDPEGRFLLILASQDKSLYRLSLLDNSPPSVLYTAGDDPHFVAVDSIGPLQHETQGRMYLFESFDGPVFQARRSLMSDSDNDGIPEGITSYTLGEYEAAGYIGDVWVDDFYDY